MGVMCGTICSHFQLGLFSVSVCFHLRSRSSWYIRPRCHGSCTVPGSRTFSDFAFLLSQHARRVPSSQPRVPVCVYSALLTAAPQLRPPPSVCAATAITAAMLISRMNPAPVSISYMTLHYTVTHLHSCRTSPCNRHVCIIHFSVNDEWFEISLLPRLFLTVIKPAHVVAFKWACIYTHLSSQSW